MGDSVLSSKRKYSIKNLFENVLTFGGIDITFLVLVLALLCYGLIMQFSASYPYASYLHDNPTWFFAKQAVFALVGIVLMLLVSLINYETWYKLSRLILIVTYGLLLLVLILPEYKPGFKRWINLGFTTFQPSEIAKFCLILQCAVIFDMYRREVFSNKVSKGRIVRYIANTKVGNGIYKSGLLNLVKESTFPFWLATLLIVSFAFLIFEENHLSGALIVFFIGVAMMYVGGIKDKWFIIGVLAVLIVGTVVCLYIWKTRDSETTNFLQGYMRERIVAWLDKDYDPRGARWQTNHSLFAIGSGGFFGLGLGNSTQKYMYVSEPQNDFIFAIVCEELGFIGAVALILLFVLLVWRGIVIGVTAKTRFGGFLSIGIVLQVGLQVLLNIAVATDSIPNTGISLPFFSYGGTSLVVFLVQMGIVLSVSRTSKIKEIRQKKNKQQKAEAKA